MLLLQSKEEKRGHEEGEEEEEFALKVELEKCRTRDEFEEQLLIDELASRRAKNRLRRGEERFIEDQLERDKKGKGRREGEAE